MAVRGLVRWSHHIDGTTDRLSDFRLKNQIRPPKNYRDEHILAGRHGALDEKVTCGSVFAGVIGTSQPLHMIKIFASLASSSASIALRSATHSREYVGSRASSASRLSIADSVSLLSLSSFGFSGFVRARLIGGRVGSRPKPSQATREP
jgi:hypothetical protein